jgi:hypothetical protein
LGVGETRVPLYLGSLRRPIIERTNYNKPNYMLSSKNHIIWKVWETSSKLECGSLRDKLLNNGVII